MRRGRLSSAVALLPQTPALVVAATSAAAGTTEAEGGLVVPGAQFLSQLSPAAPATSAAASAGSRNPPTAPEGGEVFWLTSPAAWRGLGTTGPLSAGPSSKPAGGGNGSKSPCPIQGRRQSAPASTTATRSKGHVPPGQGNSTHHSRCVISDFVGSWTKHDGRSDGAKRKRKHTSSPTAGSLKRSSSSSKLEILLPRPGASASHPRTVSMATTSMSSTLSLPDVRRAGGRLVSPSPLSPNATTTTSSSALVLGEEEAEDLLKALAPDSPDMGTLAVVQGTCLGAEAPAACSGMQALQPHGPATSTIHPDIKGKERLLVVPQGTLARRPILPARSSSRSPCGTESAPKERVPPHAQAPQPSAPPVVGRTCPLLPTAELQQALTAKADESDEFDDLALDHADLAADDFDLALQSALSTLHPTAPAIPVSPGPKAPEFSDLDASFSDFDALELGAMVSQLPHISSPCARSPPRGGSGARHVTYRRFITLQVGVEVYTAPGNGAQRYQKRVRGYELSIPQEREVQLLVRGDWYEMPVDVGHTLHIHQPWELWEEGQREGPGGSGALPTLVVDDERGIAILHPDLLISATYVADSFECLRRSILQDRIRATNDASPAMVYGNLLHALFQAALVARDFSTPFLMREITTIVSASIRDLYAIDQSDEQATAHLREQVPMLQEWGYAFLPDSLPPPPSTYAKGPLPSARPALEVHGSGGKGRVHMRVARVLDIEEHVWSPAFGIKGNIDATLEVEVDGDNGASPPCTLVAPLEVKTGRNLSAMSHRAQTMLYTLLLSDRYDVNVEAGVLYYMKSNLNLSIPALRHELRSLLMARNRMSVYLRDSSALPPMLEDQFVCRRCYVKDRCAMVHRLLEGGVEASSGGLGSTFADLTSHIRPEHVPFYRDWERLLVGEEADMQRHRREIWTLQPEEREQLGRCFGSMRVVAELPPIRPGTFVYEMARAPRDTDVNAKQRPTQPAGEEPLPPSMHLGVGDPIVISSQKGHLALGIGYLLGVGVSRITVSVDRALLGIPQRRADFDPVRRQTFTKAPGSAHVGCTQGLLQSSLTAATHTATPVYRVDKDEPSAGWGQVRNNLLTLFVERESRLRALVVDLERPTWQDGELGMSILPPAMETELARLNAGQREAIERALSARDYALILGMPGAGKTHTIACLIKCLVQQGKSVLLTAYMHTAVDNVLLKLVQEGVPFLRLGNAQKVHPALHPYLVEKQLLASSSRSGDQASVRSPAPTVQALGALVEGQRVLATTCLGMQELAALRKRFDYCIVDEASQVLLPVCLGPVRYASRFVLVGDHYQLPPLLRQPATGAAAAASAPGAPEVGESPGVTVSLFKRLCEAHPEAIISLTHQYRMNACIMALANRLIYDGRLRCGTEAVATATLSLDPRWREALAAWHVVRPPAPAPQPSAPLEGCWMARVVDPRRAVVFVDTDGLNGDRACRETREGEVLHNRGEVDLVYQMVEALLACGLPEQELGILSPYRSQLRLIRQALQKRTLLDVLTVDRYQGRDKACILLSFARSNAHALTGELLKDWRRINVALTRAKHKLILLGSRSTLQGSAICAALLEALPPDAVVSLARHPCTAHPSSSSPSVVVLE